MTQDVHPILYSFRRCPYAMRARLALLQAQIKWEHREIIFRDKPAHMLEISPKGTVPVLLLPDGTVIDESLDIMLWALGENDPDNWLSEDNKTEAMALINENDTTFKRALDRYKYPNRYEDEDCSNAREDGLEFIKKLDTYLTDRDTLLPSGASIADTAIFPFIRQFAHVDRDWFYALPTPNIHTWLTKHLESNAFTTIMKKHELWTPDS
ncbi:MAG: glutathione S-transferase [Alcanivorax sp.]